jgi:methylated-DNA-[protein]-cysteine S-methyltransferase
MANNPFPLLVPCHRCLAGGGRLGGFMGGRDGGLDRKRRMLAFEGVTVPG